MKKLIVLVALSFITTFNAQTDEEMKAWQEYMTPSKIHENMAKSNGKWSADITMWMAPGMDPIKSEGTCTNSMIMGGRYQESNFNSDFQGMPMLGKSILSYNNDTQRFTSIWIDNFGTGMMVLTGTMSTKGNAILFEGMMYDPMMKKDIKVTETYTYIDKNTEKMEMFSFADGEAFKTMEIIFTRVK